MGDWMAWEGTRALSFVHARIRQLLAGQGVEDLLHDVDGHPIHVYAAGPEDAPRTVVLLHGLGDSANNWFRLLPILAWRGDRVLALDLPGHGWSPPFDGRGYLRIREHAALVRRVVEDLGTGGPVSVVGHSLGGWVAARAILEGMEVDRFVLVESAGLAYEGMWDSIELLSIDNHRDAERFFKTICHHTPFALSLLSKELASMFTSPAVKGFLASANQDDIIRDEELSLIKARTTILWGEDDGLIPPILAHRWHAGIPDAQLVWMEKCGHAPQFERPLLFQSLVEKALGHPPLGEAVRDRLTGHLQTAMATLQAGLLGRMPDPLRRRLAGP